MTSYFHVRTSFSIVHRSEIRVRYDFDYDEKVQIKVTPINSYKKGTVLFSSLNSQLFPLLSLIYPSSPLSHCQPFCLSHPSHSLSHSSLCLPFTISLLFFTLFHFLCPSLYFPLMLPPYPSLFLYLFLSLLISVSSSLHEFIFFQYIILSTYI